MAEVWELITRAIRRFYEVALAWLGGLRLDPRGWDDTTRLAVLGAVLVLVLWLSLRRRGRRTVHHANWPQFLVTNGSIALLSAATGPAAASAPADGGRRKPALMAAPADGRYQLRMTVNNLNAFPVQLLELAVQTSAGRTPVIADAAAVLPPHGAVDVVVDLFDLPGERGSVALYLHNSASRPRSLRLLAPLEWEPWNQRYRVKGTALRLEQAGVPASEQYRRRRLGQLRRQRVRAALVAAVESVGRGVSGAWRELQAKRARAAAAAAAAREARAAASMREAPISVPLAPSRSATAGDGIDGRYPERVEWRDESGDRFQRADGATRQADGATRPADDADVDRPRERPRLDFPDEF